MEQTVIRRVAKITARHSTRSSLHYTGVFTPFAGAVVFLARDAFV